MMLVELADVLRSAGLAVKEMEGWKSRGHGPMTDVLGVTCHHTASMHAVGPTAGLSVVQFGRPDLDGPLAHLYLNREGVFHTVAAGLCYHAGVSSSSRFTNTHRIGIEALAAGDGWSRDWPEVQLAAYARGCWALARHYGFSIAEVRGHKETCAPPGRKNDPDFSMPDFRRRIGAITSKTFTKEAPDMQLTDKVKLSAAAAEAMPGRKEGDEVSISYLLQWGGPSLQRLETRVAALEAALIHPPEVPHA